MTELIGRELDAAIAERVFGLVPCTADSHRTGGTAPWFCHAQPDSPGMGGETRLYSWDILEAWSVVANLAARGWKVDVQNRYPGCYACHVHFPAHISYKNVYERADRAIDGKALTDGQLAALAICRAAIGAIEIVSTPTERRPSSTENR